MFLRCGCLSAVVELVQGRFPEDGKILSDITILALSCQEERADGPELVQAMLSLLEISEDSKAAIQGQQQLCQTLSVALWNYAVSAFSAKQFDVAVQACLINLEFAEVRVDCSFPLSRMAAAAPSLLASLAGTITCSTNQGPVGKLLILLRQLLVSFNVVALVYGAVTDHASAAGRPEGIGVQDCGPCLLGTEPRDQSPGVCSKG